ncbi:MAG: DUF4426 domain-containing protein [Gammaproteobacteria bacterium]
MIRINAPLTCTVALLATALAACSPDTGSRPATKAQEVTRASFETFGDHVVHFNAQSTTMLPAEVARAFGIRRSGNRAMLNITVLRKGAANDGMPVTAVVEVNATNLLQQEKDIGLRELRDGDGIYYIGEFTVANEEIVTFNVSVKPEGADSPHEFKFRQQFYTD